MTQAPLNQTVHKKDNVAPQILDMSIFVSRDRHPLTKLKQVWYLRRDPTMNSLTHFTMTSTAMYPQTSTDWS